MPDDLIEQIISSLPSSSKTSASGSGSGPGPAPAPKKEVTYADFEKVLASTPLFMRETPSEQQDGEEDQVLEALKSLVFEGEGDDIAENFKSHGNELHSQRSYADAIDAYTSGLNAKPSSLSIRVALLNNRAACNLALKNYRSVLKDTAALIALYSASEEIKSDKALLKGMFRAATALVSLNRWKEAQDVINRARELARSTEDGQKDSALWDKLEKDVIKGQKIDQERIERIRRDNLSKIALQKAIESRSLMLVNTDSPPDNPNPVHFDQESLPTPTPETDEEWTTPPPHAPLIFPVFLLYPAHAQSDFITHFHEDTSFDDQIAVIFPSSASNPNVPFAQWDTAKEYFMSNLVIYVETLHRRLLKVGKNLTLREVISKAKREKTEQVEKDGVVLRDGLLSFIVLVKGKQEKAWIEEFKRKRDEK